ncbi:MAG: glycosyltransferase involved in cell wall biosynthesis [Lentimonas sp.]|jgi:glycosyltransferase involved in cell wall biosynthesis
MDPLVTIIIPAYNSASTIRETLDVCSAQTWRRLQIIVVDDGSEDDTAAVVESHTDQRVQLMLQPNGGACRARNVGLHHAQGEFVQFIDADDTMEPNKIELQVRALDSAAAGSVAYGSWWEFFDTQLGSTQVGFNQGRDFDCAMDWLFYSMSEGFYLPPHCWLVPRAVVADAGPWDEKLKQNQDGEYFSRILENATAVKWVPASTSYYRSGYDASISSVRGRECTHSLIRAAGLTRDRMLAYAGEDLDQRALISALYLRILYRMDPSDFELTQQIWSEIDELGLPPRSIPVGGKKFRKLKALFGWRAAFALKHKLLH